MKQFESSGIHCVDGKQIKWTYSVSLTGFSSLSKAICLTLSLGTKDPLILTTWKKKDNFIKNLVKIIEVKIAKQHKISKTYLFVASQKVELR